MAKEELKNLKGLGGNPKEKQEEPKNQRLTYDQLAQMAQQLSVENQKLRQMVTGMKQQIESYQMQDFYQRLEWLWRVITYRELNLFEPEFIAARIKEFEMMMTPLETPKDNKEK